MPLGGRFCCRLKPVWLICLLRGGLSALGFEVSVGPINIYSVGGLIFLDGLRGVTTVFLMVVGAFRMMDPTMEEAARVAKASGKSAFFQITLPALAPAVLSAAIYSFISSMESFEGPLAIGLPGGIFVLSTLIYFTTRLQAPLEYGLGAVFGVIYMVLMLVLLVFYRRIVRHSERYSTVTGKGFRPRVVSIGKWRYPALGMFILYFVFTVGAPFFILLWASLLPSYRIPSWEAFSLVSLANYAQVFATPKIAPVVWNTLLLMVISATATMIIAFFVSWIIVRTQLKGRGALDAVVFFPHAVPGIVIALALMMAYLSPPLKYLGIYGTLWILGMGFVISYIAFRDPIDEQRDHSNPERTGAGGVCLRGDTYSYDARHHPAAYLSGVCRWLGLGRCSRVTGFFHTVDVIEQKQ